MFKKTACILIILIFTISNCSAATYALYKCGNKGAVCSSYTMRLSANGNTVDYTVFPTNDPYTFIFKDTSKGKSENYIHWSFGDGTHLRSPRTTDKKVLAKYKTVKHTFKKKGHYTGCLQVDFEGMSGTLWTHKDLKFTTAKTFNPCKVCGGSH
jgi:PKD repeat protein